MNKLVLLILDGWGNGFPNKTNAIHLANTPFIDSLNKYPNAEILTHGEHVGLPSGQMGNSEVGHMNIGAGRIVYQELERINQTIKKDELKTNSTIQKFIQKAKQSSGKVHLIGLVSDGGVHSHINHFKGLVDVLHQENAGKVFIHAFTDGRDTDPKGGLQYLKELKEYVEPKNGNIASVIGRYYAMDRDQRWERTKKAYDLLVNGTGNSSTDVLKSIETSYENGVTDEFIEPIVSTDQGGNAIGNITENDLVLFVNFRTDRPRQLTRVLTQEAFSNFEMSPLSLSFFTMTKYDSTFNGIEVVFEKENITKPIGEVLANAGKKQIRIAETEKYPHVTFFLNGGREVEFDGEKRIMVNSPKVATYDLQPEMSANEITDKILPEIQQADVDFVCLNFANADMVGHTGDVQAAIKACETVDHCVKQITELALDKGYELLITADHGNSDFMINEDGSPNTAHTTNPVPLYYVSTNNTNAELANGVLADLAPTILKRMGIDTPKEMTGKNLIQ